MELTELLPDVADHLDGFHDAASARLRSECRDRVDRLRGAIAEGIRDGMGQLQPLPDSLFAEWGDYSWVDLLPALDKLAESKTANEERLRACQEDDERRYAGEPNYYRELGGEA